MAALQTNISIHPITPSVRPLVHTRSDRPMQVRQPVVEPRLHCTGASRSVVDCMHFNSLPHMINRTVRVHLTLRLSTCHALR